MPNLLENIIHRLRTSNSIEESERNELLQELSLLQTEMEETDFMLKRIQKDKSIAVKILEATIRDLERNQFELKKLNQQLSVQKEELRLQKQIIEDNAKTLQKNLQKLELSYNELEQFSYIASHDLKSPLRTISSFAQLLKKKYYPLLEEEGLDFIDFIMAGVSQMNEVINGLLQYSRIGHDNTGMIDCDLNEVLALVKSNLKTDIEESHAEIRCPSLPTIYGNKITIIQLFQNLIHNAIKFRSDLPPLIQLSYQYLEAENQWEFSLADNGVGISQEFQKKAFLPFQRLSTKRTPGLGIGLAICYKAVNIHNGHIRYEANSEAGTTFIFTIAASE